MRKKFVSLTQQFAQSLQDALRAHAQKIAGENNLKIEYLPKKNFRKEDRIADILKKTW